MRYTAALLYNPEGDFLGYVIKKDGVDKLQSTNLYREEESEALRTRLDALNQETEVKRFWPRQDDPAVQALLTDPTWEPVEMRLGKTTDEDNSFYVWKRDIHTGELTGELDHDASVIAYRDEMVPVRPSDVGLRIHKAMETVATQRAQA